VPARAPLRRTVVAAQRRRRADVRPGDRGVEPGGLPGGVGAGGRPGTARRDPAGGRARPGADAAVPRRPDRAGQSLAAARPGLRPRPARRRSRPVRRRSRLP
jgi:hypothetical protein